MKSDLFFFGEPERGLISGIENRVIGQQLTWGEPGCCWHVVVDTAEGERQLPPESFHYDPAERRFRHRLLDLTVTLAWEPSGWLMLAKIGFEAGSGVRVVRVGFGLPSPVAVAESDETDTLYYPYRTGIKIDRPGEEVFKPYRRSDTQYGPAIRLRHLNVIEDGLAHADPTLEVEAEIDRLDHHRSNYVEHFHGDAITWGRHAKYAYPGLLSMRFLYYAGPRCGLYLGVHDGGFEKSGLWFEAKRGSRAIRPVAEVIFNRPLAAWQGAFAIGMNQPDWREAAKCYRQSVIKTVPGLPPTPEYFRRAPGVVTHYDLKWEDGTIIHRYEDLPQLADEAKALHFDTLLLAGWNNGGFDNYTFHYATDPELGTEAELKAAIRQIHAKGVKVLLYVNVLSIAADNDVFRKDGPACAVRGRDGAVDMFGETFLVHPLSTLCNSVLFWRDCVKRNVRYTLLELGVDGLYLDQIGSAPRDCHAADHDHRLSWPDNYRQLLSEIRQELKANGRDEVVFLTEEVMDLYKDLIDCFLCYAFWQCAPKYSFPELFRYTFPEVLLVDMAMQKPWRGFGQAEESHVEEIFCRQFINGLKYWTYCHAPEHPKLAGFFERAIRLYHYGVEYFIAGQPDGGMPLAAGGESIRWTLPDGKVLTTIWNPSGGACKIVSPGRTILRRLEHPDHAIQLDAIDGWLELPADKLLLLESQPGDHADV